LAPKFLWKIEVLEKMLIWKLEFVMKKFEKEKEI